jgi:hypothetical protein
VSDLSLDAANDLVGDDIDYWMRNPFLTPEMRVEKVLWWLSSATAPATPRTPTSAPPETEET